MPANVLCNLDGFLCLSTDASVVAIGLYLPLQFLDADLYEVLLGNKNGLNR
jgi:hypothetical protein